MDKWSLKILKGQYIEVPIKTVEVLSDTEAKVTVKKDGGDDPDVTHGNDVETTVTLMILVNYDSEQALALNGNKTGLAMPPGEPAINPGPRR